MAALDSILYNLLKYSDIFIAAMFFRKIEFRIGINLGDVIEDGDRIHGDGINLAARVPGPLFDIGCILCLHLPENDL